jgi:hypothetical protein
VRRCEWGEGEKRGEGRAAFVLAEGSEQRRKENE